MDQQVAKGLLDAERARVEGLLAQSEADSRSNKLEEDEPGYWSDAAQPMTAEENDDEVHRRLRQRLLAIDRAEARLATGTYGLSVKSGEPIPDERLEADPAAELTVAEAAAERR
jgi:DnaK suppressor protein